MSGAIISFTSEQSLAFFDKIRTLINLDTTSVVGDDLTPELTTVSKIRVLLQRIAQALGFNVTPPDTKKVVENLDKFFKRHFALLVTLDTETLTEIENVVQKLEKQYSTLEKECLISSSTELAHAKALQHVPPKGESRNLSLIGKIDRLHPELKGFQDYYQNLKTDTPPKVSANLTAFYSPHLL